MERLIYMKQEHEDIEEEYEKRCHVCLNFHLIENFFLQNLHKNFPDVNVATIEGGAHPEVLNKKYM